MNNLGKAQYIQQLRITTAYGGFRAGTQLVSVVFYILAALVGIGGGLFGFYLISEGYRAERVQGFMFLIGGLIAGLIYLAMGMLIKGLMTAVADIADSITDQNSRSGLPPQ